MREIRLVLPVAVVLGGCDAPSLPISGRAGAPQAALNVTVEPAAALDATPPILRLDFDLPASSDLGKVALVLGDVGAGRLHELATGDISKALRDRMIPAVVWRAASGRASLQPEEALVDGETYSLASGDPPLVAHLRVRDDASPVLERAWPPEGGSATNAFAAWCGETALPSATVAVELAPPGIAATLVRGVADDVGRRCVRLHVDAAPAGPLLPPPEVDLAGASLLLDPRPMVADAPSLAVSPAVCAPAEIAFGPGCARVEDDRIIVRSALAPLLWAVAGDGVDVAAAVAPGESFAVTGLTPLSQAVLRVAAIDAAGRAGRSNFFASTIAPEAHLVINEVLADPIGPEPDQEWIELYNDGSVAADLAAFALVDQGGSTSLPHTIVEPGAFVLVVNASFAADDGVDVPPDPNVLIVRVPKLGSDGLSNAGETLRLVDVEGLDASRFPASPKPKSGMSVARRHPCDPDGSSSAFYVAKPTPGWEGT